MPKNGLCDRCDQRYKLKQKRGRERLKDRVFAAYGGYVCKCCGETEKNFLQLDHINDDGWKHRRQIGGGQNIGSARLYSWLEKNNFPQGLLQVLCANCNWSKRHNRGKCIHQIRREQEAAASSQ